MLCRIYKVGLKPYEWKQMTLSEFLDYEYGYELRRADEWDIARNIMWSSLASMGGDKVPKPKELYPLWTDNIGKRIEKTKEKEYLSDEIVKKWVNSLE
jgi:hypothetical protein